MTTVTNKTIELKATAVTHAHIKRILHPRLGVEVEGRSCVKHLRFQDGNGVDIPGFTLGDCDLQYGDELERIVSWNGRREVKELRGRSVRMVIELKDADFYGFVFGNYGG